MDVFGEHWRDHPDKIARAWDAAVGEEDVVLVVGDVSWAHTLEEAAPDLAFLAERPGRLKVLLRGNHDSWWASIGKVRRALPGGLAALQGDALRLDEGVVLCGSRLWDQPGMPWFDEETGQRIFDRELGRLDASLAAAAALRQAGDALIALLHYPPFGPDQGGGPVMERLREAGVAAAAYGHLHGDDHAWAPRGRVGEIVLHFVAADFIGFAPQPIWDSAAGVLTPS